MFKRLIGLQFFIFVGSFFLYKTLIVATFWLLIGSFLKRYLGTVAVGEPLNISGGHGGRVVTLSPPTSEAGV